MPATLSSSPTRTQAFVNRQQLSVSCAHKAQGIHTSVPVHPMNCILQWNLLLCSEGVLRDPLICSSSNINPSHLKPASNHSICFFKHNYFHAGKNYIMRKLIKTVLTHTPSEITDCVPDMSYTKRTATHKESVLHLPKQEKNSLLWPSLFRTDLQLTGIRWADRDNYKHSKKMFKIII